MNLFENLYKTLIYDNRYLFFLEGIKNTIIIAFFAKSLTPSSLGVIIGIIIAIVKNYHEKTNKLKILNFLALCYVNIIRGTPTILQLMIIYYVIFASVEINIVFVGILAFGINSGAYVSEIIRAGINSIDKGQIEAGSSLGLNYPQIMRYIIMPQAIKNILPALGNEFITLVKETSVGAYIGIIELTKASDIVASRTYEYFFPLIIAAIIYLIITLSLSKLISIMERKLNNANS